MHSFEKTHILWKNIYQYLSINTRFKTAISKFLEVFSQFMSKIVMMGTYLGYNNYLVNMTKMKRY